MSYLGWDYEEYPKTLPADDLWGQVRRTVGGKPVAEDQLQMIVDAIVDGLAFHHYSTLLDVACGNAALLSRLFPRLHSSLGVDFSKYLIKIATQRFADQCHQYVCMDAAEYVEFESNPLRFDRALCYGSIAYMSDVTAQAVLDGLFRRFVNVRRLFIGAIPDPDKVEAFDKPVAEFDNPDSQIGVWRTPAKMQAMAEKAGWRFTHRAMQVRFYQAHYRFNALLER